jgi:hypothetical protein
MVGSPFVSMTLISSISKERRTKWLMHLVEECMNYMLRPLAYIKLILKEEFQKLEMHSYSTWNW